jgi:hypothetical protein
MTLLQPSERDLDLDLMIVQAATSIVEGRSQVNERWLARVEEYDTVSWTGVAGVTQTRDVSRVDCWEYTVQVRDYACVMTHGKVSPA